MRGLQASQAGAVQVHDRHLVQAAVDTNSLSNASGAGDSPGPKGAHSIQKPGKHQHQQHREMQDLRRRDVRQRVKVVGKCSELQGVSCVHVSVPTPWAAVWLRVLCKSGAVVVGEREATACTAAADRPCFPQDFPATEAYWCTSCLLNVHAG